MYNLGFPILKASEIQGLLKNTYNLNFITEDDITKPKTESLKAIYIRILTLIDKNLTIDSFQASESEKKKLRFPDCHQSSIPTIRLIKYLSNLLSHIGCQEDPFKLYDLIKPDYKRTRYYLSALINYLEFIDEELKDKLNNHKTFIRSKQKSEELSSVVELVGKLQSEVSSLNSYLDCKKEEISNKSLQIEELEKEKKSLLDQKQKIERSLKSLSLENEDLQDKVTSLNNSVSDAINTEKILKGRIIENSEELLNTLEIKKNELESLKNMSNKEKETSRSLVFRIESSEAILRRVNEIDFIIGNCQMENEKLKGMIKNVDKLKNEGFALERMCIQKRSQVESDLVVLKNETKMREAEKNNFESRVCYLKNIIEGKKNEIVAFKEKVKATEGEIAKKTEVLRGLENELQERLRIKDRVERKLNEELGKVKELGVMFTETIREIAGKSVYFRPFLKTKIEENVF